MRRENHEKYDRGASRKQKGDEVTSCADHRLDELTKTWERESNHVPNFIDAAFKVAHSSDYSNELCSCNNL